MKTVKNFIVTISKEEREKVKNAFDVLDTFLSKVGLEDISVEEEYEILYSIAYQHEDVCVNDEDIILKYDY